jgi:hypothetical protein
MAVNIDLGSETFHEIIYGKSERGANERRVFFVPAQMLPVSGYDSGQLTTGLFAQPLSEMHQTQRNRASMTLPVVPFGSMMRRMAAMVGAMSVMLTGAKVSPG